MSKERKNNKEAKKQPNKTAKEKKAEKRDKKATNKSLLDL